MKNDLLKQIWKDPVWSKVIATVICSTLAVVAAFLVFWFKQNPALVIGSLVVALALVIFLMILHIRSTGISVDVSGWFLGMSYSGTKVVVGSFQAKGRNRSGTPVTHVLGYIRSNITNETYPLYFNIDGHLVPPSDTHGIPPNAFFGISVPFYTSTGSPLDVEPFLAKLGDFTFTIQYDEQTYQRHFSLRMVRKQIEAFKRSITPETEPTVTQKEK
jgi:hypothetical protein